MATKTPVFGLQVTEYQTKLEGNVRWIQVIPSVDEAAMLEFAATTTKIPAVGLTVTTCHCAVVGKVRWVHVIPSVDEAAMEEL